MIVHLNGRFVPEEEARISVFDRGFLYGDGLFETLRAYRGRLPLAPAHARRLERGAALLGLPLPAPPADLVDLAREVLDRNGLADALVRIAVSRGPGPRGYSPRGARHPTLVVAAYPAPPLEAEPPPPWRLHLASLRVPAGNPLGTAKTANQLLPVLARAEAEAAGADEALLLNHEGRVAEAAAANVFWFEGDHLLTPPLSEGGLAGVTRAFVLERARASGWPAAEIPAPLDRLRHADAVCLTLASLGVVAAASLDGQPLGTGPGPARLRELHREGIRRLVCD